MIIEEDVIEYLVKAPLEQRWRILSRVALATHDEFAAVGTPAAPAATSTPAASERQHPPPSPPVIEVAPPSQRPTVAAPPPHPMVAPSPSQRPATPSQRPITKETPAPPSVAPPRPSATPPHLAHSAPPQARASTLSGTPAPAPAVAKTTPPSMPPPASEVDHAEELFEAMHELTALESAPAGARFCLEAALKAVPCLAGLVHLRDPNTNDLVVVHAQGPRADGLLRTRTPPADALVARAARNGKPTVVTYGAEPGAEKTVCPRHAFFDPWSVVIVPVMYGGQLLGLLEMVDPTDGNPFSDPAQGSLAYVAGKLGRFLAEHDAQRGRAG